MNRKNIVYRNEIRKIYVDNKERYLRTALPKRENEYILVKYLVTYSDKDGVPHQDKYDDQTTAEYKARWCVDHDMIGVEISCMTQHTKIDPMFSYALVDPKPADRQECSEAKRACNVVAHQCKNFANANCDAMPIGKSQEFQFPEIPF